MQVSVVLSTYNSAELLERVLLGYQRQEALDFELLVADDGSSAETRVLIDRMRDEVSYDLRHVWQEDHGFQKCRILNRAIEEARGDYLVVSDGDCIPWSTFLSIHREQARPRYFLSGGYHRMSRQLSESVTAGDVVEGRIEDLSWLQAHGLDSAWRSRRLVARGAGAVVLDMLTTTRPSWNGHNASAWKADLLRVNGFDERMGWGGEDRELGERLVNLGIRGRQIRHRAILMHLWHDHGYVDGDVVAANLEIRKETARTSARFTPYGIRRACGGSD